MKNNRNANTDPLGLTDSRERGGRPHKAIKLGLVVVLAVSSALVGASAAFADHWAQQGWYDSHVTFPTRPNGLNAIKSTFGNPCNADAFYNHNLTWTVSLPTSATYTPSYHKKLGGKGLAGWFTRTPLGGSNVIESVYGHLGNDHYFSTSQVRGGIGNFNCRKISGTNTYSTHAWGIAWDINWSYETYPDPDCIPNSISEGLADRWEWHNFYWGKFFPACDPMHFQYATGY